MEARRLSSCRSCFCSRILEQIAGRNEKRESRWISYITCEHLKYSHPILISICKLFNLFMINGCVPTNFSKSCTVPIQKGNVTGLQALTVFRGISISPTISNLFENAVLVRFSRYFEYQFGFKKQLSCLHAIYFVRNVIEHYVNNGCTVNVCSLDL